jgi:hypothetical protein
MTSRRKIFVILGIVLGLVLIFYVMAHSQTNGALESYKRQLRAKGEKLTIAELTPPTPTNGPNAAPALMNVAGQLQLGSSNWVPVATPISPGHLRVAWQQEILPTEDSTNIWPQLATELENMREALSQARAALTNPVLSFSLNYQQGYNLLLPHLAGLKQAEICLSSATMLALHQNQPDEAWDDLKASVNLARLFGRDEPVMISQFVRVAIGQIALNTTWAALQYRGWSEKQLTELQVAWNSFDFLDQLEPALSMDRATDAMVFSEMRNSFTSLQSFTTAPLTSARTENLVIQVFHNWTWKTHWSYEEELYTMQKGQAELEAVRSARNNHAFAPALTQLDESLAHLQKLHTNDIAHFMFDGGSLLLGILNVTDMEMKRRLLLTAIALKRYELRTGKYPDQLATLVPNFFRELPIDVMDGKPIRYRLNSDGTFLLYSVGEDGVDNGGDLTPTESILRSRIHPWLPTDAHSRSKSWWLARDAVWPMPATPEEIKAYQDKLIAERTAKDAREQSMRSFGRPPPPSNLKTN